MSVSKIPPKRLEIGHYVRLPIGWSSHPFLFNHFKIRTVEELLILQHLSLSEIEIDLSKSTIRESLAPSPMPHSLTTKFEPTKEVLFRKAQKQAQLKTERWYNDQIVILRNAITHFTSHPILSYTELLHSVEKLCAPIFENQSLPPTYLIFNSKNSDNLFTHSINVCGLTILVARILGIPLELTKWLGFAALIQDIGMLRIPYQIRCKTMPFNTAEENFYLAHVSYSLDFLQKNGNFPKDVIEWVSLHHERLDGSGYPKQLHEKDIPEIAQILQVTDYYESLLNPTPWLKPTQPQTAITMLLRNAGTLFNKKVVEALASGLGIYPPGTTVLLNNGQHAIVAASNPDDRMNPYVKLLNSSTERITEIAIDNLETLETKIVKQLPIDELPSKCQEGIRDYRIGYLYMPD